MDDYAVFWSFGGILSVRKAVRRRDRTRRGLHEVMVRVLITIVSVVTWPCLFLCQQLFSVLCIFDSHENYGGP